MVECVPSYLIESYLAGDRAAAAEEISRVRTAGELGDGVSYVRTTHIPGDETCLHLFEAASISVLGEALRCAGITHLRIVEAYETTATSHAEVPR